MEKLKSLERLIDSLSKLPSVGRKSAERMAYAILSMEQEDVEEFSSALIKAKTSIHSCPICGMMIDGDTCPICSDTSRDDSKLLIVSNAKDVLTIEESNGYKGLYHVLNGELCLSKGKTAEDLNISSLEERVTNGHFNEIILATNPTIDGETTALYIAKILESHKDIKITRLAYGLQMGGNIDYTDQVTLLKALEGRHNI